MAIRKIADNLKLTSHAKNVWKGMSEGVQRGRKFTVHGVNASKRAFAQTTKNTQASRLASLPRVSANAKLNNVKRINNGMKVNTAQNIGDFLGGGTRETIKNMKNGDSFGKALKNAHTKDGKIDMKRVAGTYVAASATGRIVSGGGLTKDKNGNNNIIGIPFI